MSRIKKIIGLYTRFDYPARTGSLFAEWFCSQQQREEKNEALREQFLAIEPDMPASEVERAYGEVRDRIAQNEQQVAAVRRRPLRRLLRVAAMVGSPVAAAVAMYAVMTLYAPQSTVWKEVYAPYGETREVRLSDGSCITINSGSRLIYPASFVEAERRVYLSGEAYADIAKDAGRRFVLSANDVDILVHGTQFNVRSYDGDSEVAVSLYEGSIDMCTKNLEHNRTVAMQSGDVVKLDKRSGVVSEVHLPGVSSKNSDNRNLIFLDSRLSDIAAQLERTFRIRIVIDDPQLADERYYSAFINGESLEQIMAALRLNGNMRCRKVDGTLHLYRKM